MSSAAQSVRIFDTNSSPFGTSFTEWTILWWRWLISIPKDRSPASDPTGEYSSISQNNHNVWFLAGTFGGSATRTCSIPYGKAILFPIINYRCSFLDEPSLKTERELEQQCKVEIDRVGHLYASVDDKNIDAQKYRIQTPCFTVSIPPDNCLGAISGITTTTSDGYWLFVEPLSGGYHRLSSFGSCLAGKIKISCTFQIHIE